MKFADLFAGIGGFHYAIKNINKNSRAVLVSEIDKYAKKAYALNHNYDIKNINDIRNYTGNNKQSIQLLKSVDDFDILVAGFPCQTFSNAGKKKGFLDKTKGTLFFDIAKILQVKKPKYVLLENVKHLAKHDDGKTWKTIYATLNNLGYKLPTEPIILSPHQFGIPQIRWRVFIPAIRSDSKIKNFDFDFLTEYKSTVSINIFDKSIDKTTIIKNKQILHTLKAWGEFIKKVKRPLGRTLPVIWLDHMNDTPLSKVKNYSTMQSWRKKYIRDMKNVYTANKKFIDNWMIKHEVSKWGKRERKLEWQAGIGNFDFKNSYVQLRQSGFRFKQKGIFPTLVAMVQTSLFFDNTIKRWRFLSKNEVRRLQSFPSNFLYNVPDYQTYKQFGNSVNIKVVEILLKKLLKY